MRYRSFQWFKLIPLILSLNIAVPSQGFAAGNVTFRKINKYLKIQGVDGDYSPEKIHRMIRLIEGIREQLTTPGKHLEEPEEIFYAKKLKNCLQWLPESVCKTFLKDKRQSITDPGDYPDLVPFLNFALNQLTRAEAKGSGEEQAYTMLIAKNVLYSIFALSYEGRPMNFSEIMAIPLTRLSTRIPYKNPVKRKRALGLKKARREARFLTDPASSTPDQFLDPSDLATLSPLECSRLDVRSDHHIWHTRKYMQKHPQPFLDLETTIRENIADRTHSPYPLDQARQIVFYDSFKDKGGTHGKIKVRDMWGIRWKLKWGNEYFTEALANRLYMALGGKHQDLNYSHTIENPVVLIFPEDHEDDTGICGGVNTYPDLKKCLAESRYQLNLDPYIHPVGYGTIQPHDLNWLLKHLNQDSQMPLSLPPDLCGKNFVVFNEVSMEFKDERGVLRSGPMSQSKAGSEDDRAMRGMLLFHMFVDNFDGKDSNGESVLIEDKGQLHFYQAPVDLGGAFRGFKFRGRGINHFKTRSFLRKSLSNPSRLVYTHPMLYRSEASDKATFSDLLWMAEKIVSLSPSVIREAVTHTHTPRFYQEVLTYRLLKRQERISELFDLKALLDPEIANMKRPDLFLDLSGEAYKTVARELHIPESIFFNEMLASGIRPGEAFRDHVVKDGKIRKCSQSLIVNILEKFAYPTGLSRSPSKHYENPGSCTFKRFGARS